MVSEIVSLVALGGAITGAVLKTLQGKFESGKKYNPRLLFGALIGAGLTSIGAVNLLGVQEEIGTYGFVGLFAISIILGAGAASIGRVLNK